MIKLSRFIEDYNEVSSAVQTIFDKVKFDNGLEEYEYNGFFIKGDTLLIVSFNKKENAYGESSIPLEHLHKLIT
jgi:hypothetical protein